MLYVPYGYLDHPKKFTNGRTDGIITVEQRIIPLAIQSTISSLCTEQSERILIEFITGQPGDLMHIEDSVSIISFRNCLDQIVCVSRGKNVDEEILRYTPGLESGTSREVFSGTLTFYTPILPLSENEIVPALNSGSDLILASKHQTKIFDLHKNC